MDLLEHEGDDVAGGLDETALENAKETQDTAPNTSDKERLEFKVIFNNKSQ